MESEIGGQHVKQPSKHVLWELQSSTTARYSYRHWPSIAGWLRMKHSVCTSLCVRCEIVSYSFVAPASPAHTTLTNDDQDHRGQFGLDDIVSALHATLSGSRSMLNFSDTLHTSRQTAALNSFIQTSQEDHRISHEDRAVGTDASASATMQQPHDSSRAYSPHRQQRDCPQQHAGSQQRYLVRNITVETRTHAGVALALNR